MEIWLLLSILLFVFSLIRLADYKLSAFLGGIKIVAWPLSVSIIIIFLIISGNYLLNWFAKLSPILTITGIILLKIFLLIILMHLFLLCTNEKEIYKDLHWFSKPLKLLKISVDKPIFSIIVALKLIPIIQFEFKNHFAGLKADGTFALKTGWWIKTKEYVESYLRFGRQIWRRSLLMVLDGLALQGYNRSETYIQNPLPRFTGRDYLHFFAAVIIIVIWTISIIIN